MRKRSSYACSTARAGASSSASNCPSEPKTSGTAISTTSRLDSSMATASTGRMRPNRAIASTPTSCCSIPMPSGSPGGWCGAMRISPIVPAAPREDLSFDRRDNARGMPKAVVVDETFNWGRHEIASQHSLGRHDYLRGPRQGPDTEARRRAAGSARHLWRALLARDDRPSQASRRHHHRVVAGSRADRRPGAGREEADRITGVTTRWRSLRRRRATRRTMRSTPFAPRWRGCTMPASR